MEGVSSFLCEKTKAQRGQGAFPGSHSEGVTEAAPKPVSDHRTCALPTLSPRSVETAGYKTPFYCFPVMDADLGGLFPDTQCQEGPILCAGVLPPPGRARMASIPSPQGPCRAGSGAPRTRLWLGCHDPSIWGLAVGPAKPPVPCWGEGFRPLGLRVLAGARRVHSVATGQGVIPALAVLLAHGNTQGPGDLQSLSLRHWE